MEANHRLVFFINGQGTLFTIGDGYPEKHENKSK